MFDDKSVSIGTEALIYIYDTSVRSKMWGNALEREAGSSFLAFSMSYFRDFCIVILFFWLFILMFCKYIFLPIHVSYVFQTGDFEFKSMLRISCT